MSKSEARAEVVSAFLAGKAKRAGSFYSTGDAVYSYDWSWRLDPAFGRHAHGHGWDNEVLIAGAAGACATIRSYSGTRRHPHDTDECQYTALLLCEHGGVIASLGGIVDPDADYKRIIAAELAMEASNG